MIRIDITTEWPELSGDPSKLQRFIFDYYGAERAELAPFPNAALYARDGQLFGFAKTYGYPRITTEGDQVFLELADLIVSLGVIRADMREPLAALAHEQWSGWMGYMFGKAPLNDDGSWTMPAWAVERWTRQMNTPYTELPEPEKVSDHVEADKVLALFYDEDKTWLTPT